MAHTCKCAVCGISFDRDKIQAVRYGARRYAHQACYPEGELVPLIEIPQEEVDLKNLKEYISQLLGDSANWSAITKQIRTFHKDKELSYTGIHRSLIYYYEVKGNDIKNSKGTIGIVPYIYEEARQYYYSVWQAKQLAKELNQFKDYEQKEIVIKIQSPETKKKRKHRFNFLEDEEG